MGYTKNYLEEREGRNPKVRLRHRYETDDVFADSLEE
jgi:hypothetical protein